MSDDPGFQRVLDLIQRVDAALADTTYGETLHVASYLILQAMRQLPQEEQRNAIRGFTGAVESALAA